MGNSYSKRLALSASVGALLLAPGVALAQTPPAAGAAPAAAAADNATVSDVVVTAQRRSEVAQKVPVTVQTYTEGQLQNLGVKTTTDLVTLVPGFTMNPSGTAQRYYLRGVGTNAASFQEVLTYIDGVYQAFLAGNILPFDDVTNIEVDVGPQGTLFGRNATGGVMQITTRDPTTKPSADVRVGYGNYDTYSAYIYASAGVTKDLSTSLSASITDQNKGFGYDYAIGKQFMKNKNIQVRNKWVYAPDADTLVRLSLAWYQVDTNNGSQVSPSTTNNFIFNQVTGTKLFLPTHFDTYSDHWPHLNTRGLRGSLEIRHDFEHFTVSSISGVNFYKGSQHTDYDGTPIHWMNVDTYSHGTGVNEEFLISSPKSSAISWVGGVFVYADKQRLDPFEFNGTLAEIAFGAPKGGAFDIRSRATTSSFAGFGQVTVPVTPTTRLTGGFRYTWDTARTSGATYRNVNIGDTGGVEIPGSRGDQTSKVDRPTWHFSVDQDFAPTVTGYLSYGRGYQAGGFNINSAAGFNPAQNPVLQPEQIDAYEAGLKGSWFDHRLRVNVSGFLYDYKNIFQQTFQASRLVTVNAAAAKIKGLDFTAEARPIRNLTLSATAELLDAHFTEYKNPPVYGLAPSGAVTQSVGTDAKGKKLPMSVPFSFTLNANYKIDSEVGSFVTSGTASRVGGWFADPSNFYKEPYQVVFNASETWTSQNGKYEISAWIRNLTNRQYARGGTLLVPAAIIGNPADPRTYGVTLKLHFE